MHGPMHGPRRARHDPRRDPKRGPRHGPRHDPTHARAGRIRCIRCIRCIRGTIRGTVRGGTRRCRHARRCCGCGCGCCPLSPLSARQSDSMHVSMSASRAWATGVHGFRRRTPLKSVSSGRPGPPPCGADRRQRSRPRAGDWAAMVATSSGSRWNCTCKLLSPGKLQKTPDSTSAHTRIVCVLPTSRNRTASAPASTGGTRRARAWVGEGGKSLTFSFFVALGAFREVV